jgi:hypothetical protein
MKLDRLETHDRYQYLMSQDFDIGKMCEKITNDRPFGNHPFYLYVHKRQIGLDERWDLFFNQARYGVVYTHFEQVPSERLIWQPRLTKPVADTNTMLFKVRPGTDEIRVIWMLPPREMWKQYQSDKMTANESVLISIDNFLNHKKELESREPDDFTEEQIRRIYGEILDEIRYKKSHPTNSDEWIKI